MFPEGEEPVPSRYLEPLEAVSLLRAGIIRPWSWEELDGLPDRFYRDFLYCWGLAKEIWDGGAPVASAQSAEGETADEELALAGLSRTLPVE